MQAYNAFLKFNHVFVLTAIKNSSQAKMGGQNKKKSKVLKVELKANGQNDPKECDRSKMKVIDFWSEKSSKTKLFILK